MRRPHFRPIASWRRYWNEVSPGRRRRWRDCSCGVAHALGQRMAELERRCVVLTDFVGPISAGGDALQRFSAELASLVGEFGACAALPGTVTTQPFALVESLGATHAQLPGRLGECEAHMTMLLRIRAQIAEALAPLTYVAVLMRIEAARLGEEDRDAFFMVTAEMERSRRAADESLAGNTEALRETQATLARLQATIAHDLGGLTQEAARQREQLTRELDTLNAECAQRREAASRMRSLANAAAQEVGRMINDLQFQDAVQQKSAHVAAALVRNVGDYGHQALLQASQLDAAAQDIRAAHAGLRRAVAELHDGDRGVLTLLGRADASAEIGHAVEQVRAILDRVQGLLQAAADLATRLQAQLEPIQACTQSVSATLIDLAVNMRLIGLNAQIRSLLHGSGTGLEELSATAARISGEVTELAHANADRLAQVAPSFTAALAMVGAMRDAASAAMQEFAELRRGPEARLAALRERLHASLQEGALAARDLSRTLHRVDQAVMGLVDDADALDDFAAEVREFAAEPRKGATPEELRAQIATYTMASERRVHEEALLTARRASPAAHDDAAQPFAAATGGGSVELF